MWVIELIERDDLMPSTSHNIIEDQVFLGVNTRYDSSVVLTIAFPNMLEHSTNEDEIIPALDIVPYSCSHSSLQDLGLLKLGGRVLEKSSNSQQAF